MSLIRTLADKLKALASVSDATGKSVLLMDGNGNLSKASASNNFGLKAESANTIVTRILTNEDLDELIVNDFCNYLANTGNTVKNKPAGVNGFNLSAFRASNGNAYQILYPAGSIDMYMRRTNPDGWLDWKRILTEDDLTSLIARIEALESS